MKKILIVDDEEDIVELVANRLKANNYDIICASDGEEGIRKAQQQKPDLIVMDIMMPHMPGGDAVKLLMADEKTKHIPVVFLTGVMANMPQEQEERGINIGGHFFTAIGKPFKSEKLLLEIRKLIG